MMTDSSHLGLCPAQQKRPYLTAKVHRQHGVVLFVALIVMVALALATVALMRSVDTANVIAGNQSFKQSALNATDLGVAKAVEKFAGGFLSGNTLLSDNAVHCYRATAFQPNQLNANGVPLLLVAPTTIQTPFLASFDSTYPTCNFTNTQGEKVRYIIDRQCDASMAGLAATKEKCIYFSQSSSAGQLSGSDPTDQGRRAADISTPYYRVTVRVDGPRNTVSIIQAVIKP